MTLTDNRMPRLIRAGLFTGISDFLFATVLSVFFYNSTFTRLWQGVASVPLGKGALEGGSTTVMIGILMHFAVAFFWSALFLFVMMRMGWVQRVLASPGGTIKMAALYGPAIWLVMSFVVIPFFVHHPPAITSRWWIQFIGHFPFVGLPMVTSLAGWNRR